MQEDFAGFLPMGTKEAKAGAPHLAEAIFHTFCPGVNTGRDIVAYDFSRLNLRKEVKDHVDAFNSEVERFQREGMPNNIDDFVDYEKLKWSERHKDQLKSGKKVSFDQRHERSALYRPFSKRWLYLDSAVVNRPGQFHLFFPMPESPNLLIVVSESGHRVGFALLATDCVADLHALSSDGFQCFPLYVYNADGTNRRENVTDWALGQFRAAYGPDVTKEDIFYYVYALLHHPEYRTRYAENLKRELPRVPLVTMPTSPPAPSPGQSFLLGEGGSDAGSPFPVRDERPHPEGTRGLGERLAEVSESLADSDLPRPAGAGGWEILTATGRALAALHVGYETVREYPLGQSVNRDVPFTWRVTKMKLNKDAGSIAINDALTLTGIPAEVFDYKLGNRSALEWVVDQYQVSKDKRTGMVSDPNRDDDPEYIARLVRKVVTVSVETVQLVQRIAAVPHGT